jgi:transcriptional regulator with XRE-family HTH domain
MRTQGSIPHARGIQLPNLRAWRMYKLMSTRALSAASGVSGNTINALENQNGRALFGTIGKLAQGLGITPQELVYEQPPKMPGLQQGAGEEGRAVA